MNEAQELAEIRMEIYDIFVRNPAPFHFEPKDLIFLLENIPDDLIAQCGYSPDHEEIVLMYLSMKLYTGWSYGDIVKH